MGMNGAVSEKTALFYEPAVLIGWSGTMKTIK
jgi:hypothetical protein